MGAHIGPVTSVDWSNDDGLVASSSNLGDIIVNNPNNGTTLGSFG